VAGERPPLGQHFLVDGAIVDRLVALAEPAPGEVALDVGAGPGAIALRLAAAVGPQGRVVAVELDGVLAQRLRATAPPHVEVVEGDALALPLPEADLCAANLPFQVAAPLLLRLLDAGVGRMALVVPRELADRLLAARGSARYGRLTVQVALRAKVRRAFDVPPVAFAPPPRVPTCVVRVDPRAPPRGLALERLDELLEHAWASRQRTLRHGLAPLANAWRISSGAITEALRARGWEQATPGDLAPADFAALVRDLAPR
jgi:16S rRNA (adenine1518-N6/adenine1519-N6)-dimethyltransferase